MGGPTKLEEERNDQIVQLLGNFGKWQLILIVPIAFFGIMSSWEVLVTSFLSPDVDYWCSIQSPSTVVNNRTEWEEIASPTLENGKKDKCNIFDLDYSSMKSADEILNAIAIKNQTRPCQKWSYDSSVYPRTIITDFDLVCNRDWFVTLTQSMFMLGFMVGVFGSGLLSDRFGRQKTFFYTSTALSIFALCTAFSSSIEVYIFMRFWVAATNATCFLIGYVYCMELVGGQWKTYIGVGLEFPWATGYSILPGIAYVLRDWTNLKIALACPIFLSVVSFYFLPESPRWLLSKGRLDEARVVLEKGLKVNGREWPEGFHLKKIEHAISQEKISVPIRQANVLDLFRTRNMLKKTLIQMYVWFTASFVYYGLTLNSDTLIPGDLYINFAIGGLIEFPAYILTTLLLHYVGRRYPQSATYIFGGLALLFNLASPTAYGKSILSQLGKFGVTCAFAIIYVYAAELYPTVLRSTGMGMSSVMARLGSILAPVVGRELGRQNQSAAIIIFGSTSILAGILTLFLPETHGQKLPDTLQEGEEFGKHESIADMFRKRGSQSAIVEDELPPPITNSLEKDNHAFTIDKSV